MTDSLLNHPKRAWRLQGATNFRDLGGYLGHGGRPVVWGQLFRSDHLGNLSDADKTLLAGLPLAQSFDFRGIEERAATPYSVPGLVQHALSIEPSVTQRMQDLVAAGNTLTPARVAELMQDLYRSLVRERAPQFAEFFQHVLQAEAPLVFHCTAGKDRTGVAAALLLSALGVERRVIEQDFLLTNALYRHAAVPSSDTPRDVLAVLWSVQAGFLDAALQVIDNEHGGMQRYLATQMGLDAAAMKTLAARYLTA